MNLNSRQKLLATLAIVAVGLFMADKILIKPLTKSWDARSKRLGELKEKVKKGTETLKRDKTLTERWERMTANVLSAAKPEAESQMSKAFERWAQAGGVVVSSTRTQWRESEDAYKTLELRADVSGNLPELTRFLYALEREPLAVKVDSLELQARDTEGTQLALVVSVNGLLINPEKGEKR
jgi:hypothetical protein